MNDYDQAVQLAYVKYPWLGKLGAPIRLTAGEGPYESETYMPDASDNPMKGSFTVELRSAKAKGNKAAWPGLIASEGLDYLARRDPRYQNLSQAFRQSMTPDQLRASMHAYQREQQEQGEQRSFEDFLRSVQIQEYVRGFLFPEVAPGWIGPKGEGQYTPAQIQLLTQFRNSLNQP